MVHGIFLLDFAKFHIRIVTVVSIYHKSGPGFQTFFWSPVLAIFAAVMLG